MSELEQGKGVIWEKLSYLHGSKWPWHISKKNDLEMSHEYVIAYHPLDALNMFIEWVGDRKQPTNVDEAEELWNEFVNTEY